MLPGSQASTMWLTIWATMGEDGDGGEKREKVAMMGEDGNDEKVGYGG